MKICFKCLEEKPLSEFYKHKKMSDGHLNKCKICTKKNSIDNFNIKKNDIIWLEKERERHRDKYHRLDYKDKHKPTKESKKLITIRYKNKYPEKINCNKKMKVKPIKGFNLHHWNYNIGYENDIFILSILEHNKVHRFITYDNTLFVYRKKENGELLDTRQKHKEYIDIILNNFK